MATLGPEYVMTNYDYPMWNWSFGARLFDSGTVVFSSIDGATTSSIPYTVSALGMKSQIQFMRTTVIMYWSRITQSSGALAVKRYVKQWNTLAGWDDNTGATRFLTANNTYSYTSDSTNWTIGTGNAGYAKWALDGGGGFTLNLYNPAGSTTDGVTYSQNTWAQYQIEYFGY